MKITFTEPSSITSEILVVGVASNDFDEYQRQINDTTNGQLNRIITSKDFKINQGSIVSIPYPHGLDATCLIVVGMGSKDPLKAFDLEKMGAKIWSSFGKSQAKSASVYIPVLNHNSSLSPQKIAAYIANGLLLKSWSFEKYHTKKKETDICAIKTIQVLNTQARESKAEFDTLKAISEGVFLTRTLVTEPPNILYPESFAEEAQSLKDMGIKVDVYGKKELKEMGLRALLGVGQGSAKDSQLVVMQWQGGDKKEAPIAFVGKGVTFDTGGISLKPAQDMDEMKADMGGAGAVVGLMKGLAGRKAKCNVVGVIGVVENMPDGKAQRPGDVVTSLSGQTIEILNTDAEGRLVLADALWYTQDRFKPKMMVDIATLTGAMRVALGVHHAGIFANDDTLANELIEAGKVCGEKLWRLPLGDAYDKEIDSVIADVKNLGGGNGGGSITAAQFLQRFVNKTKWAHVDIASTAWDKKGKDLSQAGATAIGVRLFNQWLQDNYG